MNQQTNLNQFNYELMEEKSVPQNGFYKSIEINKENTFLLASTDITINVFVFQQGFIKLISQLQGHRNYVTSLKFLNKKSRFLSGSLDKSIIIWSQQLLANQKYIQKIKDHQNPIVALVIHPNIENMFISASYRQILFYQYSSQKQWICLQKITEIDGIFGLSINENGTKIVLCSENHIIVILELQQLIQQQKSDQIWIVKQKIKVRQWGFRVCFLNNDTFVFQPVSKNWNGTSHLNVYTLNKLNEFKIQRKIPIKGGGNFCINNFPSQYNKQKYILLVKNGNYINLFKYTEGKFRLKYKQALCFDITKIYGTLSQDGEYLITWDEKQRQIQIRKYTELKKIQTIE
ncbi:unnamed protein product [Paramecium pentaurelia]|uniref:Uncharacterized protein n=1 Tax=Paramecium pentaurelia TaxID=43138 RepID=A0A8S1UN33_9CILI|nr:unnamed protein product [Paramecium pentaurelia]